MAKAVKIQGGVSEEELAAWRVRHNLTLGQLAADPDLRYRPSRELTALVRSNPMRWYANQLDRPLVPVLNALVAKGLRTLTSCADAQVTVAGGSAEAVRLLRPLLGRLQLAHLEWAVRNGQMLTELRWRAVDREANDAALMEGAQEIAGLEQIDPSEIYSSRLVSYKACPQAALVSHVYARLSRLCGGVMDPVVSLKQEKHGYELHTGYSTQLQERLGKKGTPATDFHGSLAAIAAAFEEMFGTPAEPEEAVESVS